MNTDSIFGEQAQSQSRVLLLPAPPRAAPVKLLESAILLGCNVHHTSTVIRQAVDLGALAGMSSAAAGADFPRRFLERFRAMRRSAPECDMPQHFLQRLRSSDGIPFEEVLLEAILAVETAIAFRRHDFVPIEFSEIVPTRSPNTVLLIWECKSARNARRAAQAAVAGFVELLPRALPVSREGSADFAASFAALEQRARDGEMSTTAAVLVLAAHRRGLPCEVVQGPHLRLGHGASQRLIYASVTDHTSLAASQLARNKHKTNRLLAALHLPVAKQVKVGTSDEALAAAEMLGYPVVIKPLKQNQAAGVTVGIAGPKDIPAAFARAEQASQRHGQRIIVEQHLRGHDHRLLVIGGRFVAALRTLPPTVIGDGARTIAELVEELNNDPSRDGVRLFKVPVDDALVYDLERSGHGLGEVLGKGETVVLRSAENVAIGGVHTDVTDLVHPDNQQVAVRAAEAIGLDVAGIDFVTEDISRSYKEAGGGIIEVNARPGLCMHTWPRFGKSRPVAAAVLDLVFPAGANGRIPIAVVSGRRGKALVARDLEKILRSSGRTSALAMRKRCFVDAEAQDLGRAASRDAVAILLRDKRVQALISCVSPRHAVSHGLGLDMCDVAAITDRDAGRSASLEAVRVLGRATRGLLVINAGNKLAREALGHLDAKRLVMVGSNSRDPTITAHAASGGVVVVKMRETQRGRHRLVLCRKGKSLLSVPVPSEGAESPRVARRRTESRMLAMALAYGMGVSSRIIEAALSGRLGRRAERR